MKFTIAKAVYLAAATDFVADIKELRAALQGVNFKPGSGCTDITATNGHVLLRIEDSLASNPDLTESITVRFTKDQVAAFRKVATYNEPVHLAVDGLNVTVELNGTTSSASVIEVPYPDADRIIPPADTTSEHSTFNADYVAKFSKASRALAKAARSKYPMFTVKPNGLTAARIDFEGLDDETVVGVVMPIRKPAADKRAA